MSQRPGNLTRTCRLVCSALVVAPLLYVNLVTDGDAYHFLALVLIAPIAGLVLVANSLFCLFRYRKSDPGWVGLLFLLVGALGVFEAWHFLPQFRM